MEEFRELEIGMCVRIKRTDGSVHETVISQLRAEDNIVMVEWTEGGEYKGKEVSYNDIYAYNPELRQAQEPKRPKVTKEPPPPAPPSAEARSRPSTIREVERLKKNRDQRRLVQAKRREEKKTLIKMYQDNPNWEYQSMITDFRNSLTYRKISDSGPSEAHQITVCVRKRPMNQSEITKKEVDVITVPDNDTVIVHEPKCKVDLSKFLDNQVFKFDFTFDETCDNDIVYRYTARPLVESIFEGGVATCFAYGQTGSGKTFTMGGAANSRSCASNGIYAKTAADIFKYLKSERYAHLGLSVSASFFEIYREKLFDLLSGKAPLRVYEDMKQQVHLIGLSEREVDRVEDILELIKEGNNARTQGKTTVNAVSSRSHAVFQLILRRKPKNQIHGKICLIDLAGNERGGQSVTKRAKVEGADINKSLLALKECIRALGRKDNYLPFRGSKLTQVLRDAFIGDKARTCMIAMVSPGLSACKNTLNTLRYADRVKELTAGDVSSCEENAPEPIPEQTTDQESAVEPDIIAPPPVPHPPLTAISPLSNISTPPPPHNYCNIKETRLKEEYLKYLANSVDWSQRETQLYKSLEFSKLSTVEFINSFKEVLNERCYHIRNLLNLGEEICGFANLTITDLDLSTPLNGTIQ